MTSLPVARWNRPTAPLKSLLNRPYFGQRIHVAGQLIGSEVIDGIYASFLTEWMPEDRVVLAAATLAPSSLTKAASRASRIRSLP